MSTLTETLARCHRPTGGQRALDYSTSKSDSRSLVFRPPLRLGQLLVLHMTLPLYRQPQALHERREQADDDPDGDTDRGVRGVCYRAERTGRIDGVPRLRGTIST